MQFPALCSNMVQRSHADDRSSATETKFYLPAGLAPSSVASRVESIWATLFNHFQTSR